MRTESPPMRTLLAGLGILGITVASFGCSGEPTTTGSGGGPATGGTGGTGVGGTGGAGVSGGQGATGGSGGLPRSWGKCVTLPRL